MDLFDVMILVTLFGSTLSQGDDDMDYYVRRIMEELPAGTLIGDVTKDTGLADMYSRSQLDQLRFSFLEGAGMDYENFAIDETTGIIRTKTVIDRDTLCPYTDHCFVYLTVAVGPNAFFRVINMRVEILDTNDNAPTFPFKLRNYQLSEASDVGTTIAIDPASDPDSGLNTVNKYKLLSPSPNFQLLVRTGFDNTMELKLQLSAPLDREIEDHYQLTVVAYDGGQPPSSGSVIINITVQDANDNPPIFASNASYDVTVREDAPVNTTVLRVTAYDADTGINGQIVYTFTTRTQGIHGRIFGILATTGDIYLKAPLDYESESLYQLSVKAEDLGPDSQPAYTTVMVTVLDVNDNAPQITVNTLTATGKAEISEDSENNTFVAHINAVDHDSGDNGRLSCSMNSNMFRLVHLHRTQYKIVTNGLLDREITGQYNLQLTCADHGDPAQTTIRPIIVNVIDENDNSPVFTRMEYRSTVMENNRANSVVVRVNATDKDAGLNGRVRYSMDEQSQKYFNIDEKFGTITVPVSLDHEASAEMLIIVTAQDNGERPRSSTAHVIVTVSDMNDRVPVFTQSQYSFGVGENKRVDTVVGLVTAIDADSPPFNVVEYKIGHGGLSNAFRINSKTGEIRTIRVLDREIRQMYQFSVVAYNPGHPGMSSTASVTVHVNDANDHTPVIDFPERPGTVLQVSSQIPVGYVISRVRAHDQDIGNNGKLSYHFTEEEPSGLFYIDSDTGALTTKAELSNIAVHNATLKISVSDNGNPSRTNYTQVIVVVNHTIAYKPPAEYYTSPKSGNNNMIVVIGLSSASAAVLLLLIIVLVYIRRQSAQRQARTYRCRPEAEKMLHKSEGKDGEKTPVKNCKGVKITSPKKMSKSPNESLLKKQNHHQNNGRSVPDGHTKLTWDPNIKSDFMHHQPCDRNFYDTVPHRPNSTGSNEVSSTVLLL